MIGLGEAMRENFIKSKIDEIKAIELTDEEKEAALFEGQIKKFFHEKNRHYWEKLPGAYDNDKGAMTGQSF